MVMSYCVGVSLSCHTVWWIQDWNGAASSVAGLY